MTIDEIKSISILQWMRNNNYGEGVRKGKNYFFRSPLRLERTPSFAVNTTKNLWCDFGNSYKNGGNIINLVEQLNPTWSKHQVLSFLEQQIRDLKLSFNEDYNARLEEDEEKIHFLYLVDGLIGTEYAKNRMEDKRHMMLGPDSFKNDAIIMKGITSKRISLMHRYKENPVFTVEFSDFPYLGIWSKPNAPFLCIEPWHGFSDSIKSSGIFAEKTGSILLKPGQSYECRYSIKFYED